MHKPCTPATPEPCSWPPPHPGYWFEKSTTNSRFKKTVFFATFFVTRSSRIDQTTLYRLFCSWPPPHPGYWFEKSTTNCRFKNRVLFQVAFVTSRYTVVMKAQNISEASAQLLPDLHLCNTKPCTRATHEPCTRASHKPCTHATHKPCTRATHKPCTRAAPEPCSWPPPHPGYWFEKSTTNCRFKEDSILCDLFRDAIMKYGPNYSLSPFLLWPPPHPGY